jgi:hypothetical protein
MAGQHGGFKLALSIAALGAALALLVFYWKFSAGPTVRYTVLPEGGMPLRSSTPPRFGGEVRRFQLHIAVEIPTLTPEHLLLGVDDCLDRLFVNGQPVLSEEIPYCNSGKLFKIPLPAGAATGIIRISAQGRNIGGPGGGELLFPPLSAVRIVPLASILLLVLIFGVLTLDLRKPSGPAFWLRVSFLGGAALRIIYYFGTQADVRAHDHDGHLEYVTYVWRQLSLPASGDGWEFYQPPLYYALCAALGRLAGLPAELLEELGAGISLAAAVAALGCQLWLGSLIFRRKEQSAAAALFGLMLAVCPAAVFFSSRVNNDGLATFFASLSFALLVRWHQEGRFRDWSCASAACALGFITKLNTLALAPAAALLLLIKPGMTLKGRGMVAAGPLYGRFSGQKDSRLVANCGSLHPGLRLPNSFDSFTVFNPVELMRTPYNDPWRSSGRRANFWEYLYRSIFFGEFRFERQPAWLSGLILLLGFEAALLVICGIVSECRSGWRGPGLPFLALLLLAGASQVALRLSCPAATSQDFRYLVFALPCLAFFAARAFERFSPRWQGVMLAVCLHLYAACAIFLLGLYASAQT